MVYEMCVKLVTEEEQYATALLSEMLNVALKTGAFPDVVISDIDEIDSYEE